MRSTVSIAVTRAVARRAAAVVLRIGKENLPFDQTGDHLQLRLKVRDVFLQVRGDDLGPFFVISGRGQQRSNHIVDIDLQLFQGSIGEIAEVQRCGDLLLGLALHRLGCFLREETSFALQRRRKGRPNDLQERSEELTCHSRTSVSTHQIPRWIDVEDQQGRLGLLAELENEFVLIVDLGHLRPFVRTQA